MNIQFSSYTHKHIESIKNMYYLNKTKLAISTQKKTKLAVSQKSNQWLHGSSSYKKFNHLT